MQMRVKMQQPAYKCEKMQMRALFVNGPIPVSEHFERKSMGARDQIYIDLMNCNMAW